MPTKITKILGYILLVVLSPLLLAVIACAIVIVVYVLRGETLSTAFDFLITKFADIYPLLPYITGIPAISVVVGLAIKNFKKIQKLLMGR